MKKRQFSFDRLVVVYLISCIIVPIALLMLGASNVINPDEVFQYIFLYIAPGILLIIFLVSFSIYNLVFPEAD